MEALLVIYMSLFLGFQAGDTQADTKKVKKEVGEAVEAAKEEFVSKTNEELAALDREIEDLKERARVASAETQAKFNEQIKKIEQEREAVSQKLDEVAKSSGNAWKKLQSGAKNAWNELKASVKNAGKEFKK